ncbi:unnamed protein product [Rotaria sp. Silwood1]|nr:unnamed protein product [Rotaria sp. Silwood1]CAF3637500.1 unnamed protein product [Rotaria sp. Silwood1]CAF4697963.1 unnamed protein product [Rotaria sp. Silwood1]
MNECNDNEYRCTNGQSYKYIHQSLVRNGVCQCELEDQHWCEDEDFHIHYVRKNISFQTICDEFTEPIPITIEGQNETECEQWSCNNIYINCDSVWNCPHDEDDVGCDLSSTLNCFLDYHKCVSPHTNELICLPVNQANDGKINCLDATDESTLCREKYQVEFFNNFYCMGKSYQPCIHFHQLCEDSINCDHGDDERFCVKN